MYIRRFLFFFIIALNLQILNSAQASSFVCENIFSEQTEQADQNRLVIPTPNILRNYFSTSNLRNVLYRWKPDTSSAHQEARVLGLQELKKMGLKNLPSWIPNEGLAITPDMLPSSSYVSLFATALKHPKMKKILKEMNEAGYQLLIDPTMAVKSDNSIVFGSYRSSANTIRLLPKANWEVFIHEYQHLNFDRLGFRGENFFFEKTDLPADVQKIANRVYALKKKGLNNLAIDETLAVREEIKALYKMGYMPWTHAVYQARRYAWDHQLKGFRGNQAQWDRLERTIQLKAVVLFPEFLETVLLATGTTIFLISQDEEEVIAINKDNEMTGYKVPRSEDF